MKEGRRNVVPSRSDSVRGLYHLSYCSLYVIDAATVFHLAHGVLEVSIFQLSRGDALSGKKLNNVLVKPSEQA